MDPLTFAGMSVVLLDVGLLASYLPARRAAGVDPAESRAPRWLTAYDVVGVARGGNVRTEITRCHNERLGLTTGLVA